MISLDLLLASTNKLQQFIEDEDYTGYDPYDALTSPIFKLPILKSQKQIRFLSQQLIKRFPINLRPVLFIKKDVNPVTLGLCIQGYANRYSIYNDQEDLIKINQLVDRLILLKSTGFHGNCWGYNFPWEARYASMKAFAPTVVATGIITHSLYEAYRITKNENAKKLIIDSLPFILHDLNKTIDDDGTFCFSYSPTDHEQVINASMKGLRLISEVYSFTQDNSLIEIADKGIRWVLKQQQNNGSWFYSRRSNGNWIDNYHTAYVLDCLDSCKSIYNPEEINSALKKGYEFYQSNFFEISGQPKFYLDKPFPVDCTAGGQSLLTLSHFKDYDLAQKVATYMIDEMQSKQGGFYFRKHQNYLTKTSYMRWSNAWMFAGLWKLISCLKK